MATAAEIAEYDTEELERQLAETRRELFNLRFQLATGQLDNFSRIGHVRKDVARMMTELRIREIAEAEGLALDDLPGHRAAARRRSEDEALGRDKTTASERRAKAKAEAAAADDEARPRTRAPMATSTRTSWPKRWPTTTAWRVRRRGRPGRGRRRRPAPATQTQRRRADGRRADRRRVRRANARKVREGLVVSDAMDATVVVAVVERVRHPRYGKTVQRTKRLYVHDAENAAKVGDRVRVVETRRCPSSSAGGCPRSWSVPDDPAGIPAPGGRQLRRQGGAVHQGARRLPPALRLASATSSWPR